MQAELSGDYADALEIYRELMDRLDTRYEKNDDSQESSRGMDEEDDKEDKDKDGEGGRLVGVGIICECVFCAYVTIARLVCTDHCIGQAALAKRYVPFFCVVS